MRALLRRDGPFAACAGRLPRREVLRLGLALAATSLSAIACERSAGRPALTVFAASSLTEVFRELGGLFERAHPGDGVEMVFAGSQVSRVQLEHGARADLFASANEEHVRGLERAGMLIGGRVFTDNVLVVIVPPDNPARLERFEHLARARRLVIGSVGVPVGDYARLLLQQAEQHYGEGFADRVLERVVSEESNARLVKAKVEMGEADAAIVYRTDALASERVLRIELPAALRSPVRYRLGVLRKSPRRELAQAFADFLFRSEAREVFRRHGFGQGGR